MRDGERAADMAKSYIEAASRRSCQPTGFSRDWTCRDLHYRFLALETPNSHRPSFLRPDVYVRRGLVDAASSTLSIRL